MAMSIGQLLNTVSKHTWALVMVSLMFAATIAPAWAAGPLSGINSSSRYLQYYGIDFSLANLNRMLQYDVVVLSPNALNITPSAIAYLQNNGVKYVLGYISIGEESGLVPMVTALTLPADPYAALGPASYDAYTHTIIPKNAGFASYYVDDEWNGATYVSDGAPDTNVNFGGRFVNPDALWRWVIDTQRRGGSPQMLGRVDLAGLAQIVGPRLNDADTDPTHDFGFDGFFLDTLDTSGPFENSWGYYPWTAPAMQQTVQFIAAQYPTKSILANRGVFFYNHKLINTRTNIRPYDYNIRPYIGAIMFESHTLDSSLAPNLSPYFADNVYNYGPKVDAEATRPDGFTVFGLDYAMGRSQGMLDFAYSQAVVENGWSEYISEYSYLDTVGTYAPAVLPIDSRPPVWDSVNGSYSLVPMDVPDRIGVQDLRPGANASETVVYWDVARDQSLPTHYHIDYSSVSALGPFTRLASVPFSPAHTSTDPAAGFANKFTVTGLTPGTRYYFRVRAEDSALPAPHEDSNNVIMSMVAGSSSRSAVANPVVWGTITVDGYTSDWSSLNLLGLDANDIANYAGQIDLRSIAMADDYANLYLTLTNDGPIGPSLSWGYRIFLDTDQSSLTGYRGSLGIGADYMIEGNFIYVYAGTGADFLWAPGTLLATTVQDVYAEYMIPRTVMGNPTTLDLVFYGDNSINPPSIALDLFPDQAISQGQFVTYQANALAPSPPADLVAPVLSIAADVYTAATGVLTAVPLTPATAYDQVDGYVQVYTNAPTLFPANASTIVTYTAVDNSGNTVSANQLVTVSAYVDNIPPVVIPPSDIYTEAASAGGALKSDAAIAMFLQAVTATDNVSIPGAITNNAPATFPFGTTTVIFSAVDAAGNTGTAQANVTVQDTTAPTITVAANIIVQATSASGVPATNPAIVAFLAAASASDIVGVVTPVTHNAPPTFPLGITTVTFSASDAAGNTGSAQATVTILPPPPAPIAGGGGGGCLVPGVNNNYLWMMLLMMFGLIRVATYRRP